MKMKNRVLSVCVAVFVAGSAAQAALITFNDADLGGSSVRQWTNLTNYRYTEGDYVFGASSSFNPSWNGGVAGTNWVGDIDGSQYGYLTAGAGFFMKRTDEEVFTLNSLSLQNGSASVAGSVRIYKDFGLGTQSEVAVINLAAREIKENVSLNIADASNIYIEGIINTGNMYGVDNVSVVPEPATAGFMGISGVVLLVFRRLKKYYQQ
ncbi:PEP-CTERM sorting domain-containing protein [Tichowtungia aerotolerans]|uniref:PEP-CTERM sorting domain-containing protein n=1 Tax=Tichowtungia aerotolerans TaxID=2697043 RepID=A0A6P1M5P5_9BACT|nr:PEP-CTERM sorting domain-containing protein [Tichowtungia aerotolerans]QHI70109.1 PEP-CTERM sorting domain-containing protein [Tichowtungia aerotolerans]